MNNRLKVLGQQVSSLEGATLEISVSSNPIFSKEIKSFIAAYGSKDMEHLARL